MQRRDFLTTTALGGATIAAAPLAARAADDNATRCYYEWRTYQLKDATQHPLVEHFLEKSVVPAWERLKFGPVGVFKEVGNDATPAIHVLLTYPSLEAIGTVRDKLDRDRGYLMNATEYLAAAKDNPAYNRIDSWLLQSFAAAPQPTPPTKKPKLYELRTYENHGEDRARAKVAMFNDGEIDIFPKCGFENVFFGETLIGSGIPSLKYMLASPDMDANAEGWKTFIGHPDFIRMRDDPKYANTEPNITKLYLEPTAYSQV
jgi:hypothetical protein